MSSEQASAEASAPAPPPRSSGTGDQQQLQAAAVTLDWAREHFFVAARSVERFGQQLRAFSDGLHQAAADSEWLSQAQAEAGRVVEFHRAAAAEWAQLQAQIDAYVASVRALAEGMVIADLKGERAPSSSADGAEEDPENRARLVHPELVRFQLEKRARILGKIGGVPALGPGMAAVLPQLKQQGGAGGAPLLRATESPAAVEIAYTKAENRDAAQLAQVFQFRQRAATSDLAPHEWQQAAAAQAVRRNSDAQAAEARRLESQESELAAAGAGELADKLRARQQALRGSEQGEQGDEAARRAAAAAGPSGEPSGELAAALLRRRASGAPDGGGASTSSAEGGGGGAAAHNKPPPPAGAVPLMPAAGGCELAKRLAERVARLSAREEGAEQQQQQQHGGSGS